MGVLGPLEQSARSGQSFLSYRLALISSTLLPNTYQAIKAVKRNNPRAEKMNLLRRRNLPTSPHTPLTDKLGSLEQKIRKEIAIMKKCRHGHIVRLLEVIDDKLNDRIYMGKLPPSLFAANLADFPPYLLPDSASWASISIEEL